MKSIAKPVCYRPGLAVRVKLDEMSRLTGIPINTIVDRAVSAYLDEIEEWYRLQPGSATATKEG
jgi:predicted DNA-binding protein